MSKTVILVLENRSYEFVPINKNTWELTSDLTITLSQEFHQGKTITIPMGFLTDFRSGPGFLNKIVPKTGLWYVIHDWLYRNQISTRHNANHEQNYWMVKYNVNPKARRKINWAVRSFGSKYWNYYKLGGTYPYSRKKLRRLLKENC